MYGIGRHLALAKQNITAMAAAAAVKEDWIEAAARFILIFCLIGLITLDDNATPCCKLQRPSLAFAAFTFTALCLVVFCDDLSFG